MGPGTETFHRAHAADLRLGTTAFGPRSGHPEVPTRSKGLLSRLGAKSLKRQITRGPGHSLGDRGEIFTSLRERQGLKGPLSSTITLIAAPFDSFMPGERTQFDTVNATDVKTGPADFWQLFLAQHSVEIFVGTANDMLIGRYWKGEPGYQPFRLRCLSRLNRPDQCSQAQYCSLRENEVLQSLTGYSFAQMCSGSIVPPP